MNCDNIKSLKLIFVNLFFEELNYFLKEILEINC